MIDIKQCPFCSEDIKKEARKCKHCNEIFEKGSIMKVCSFQGSPKIECIKCGYTGKAKKYVEGSDLAGLILFLFFIIPGLIYDMCRKRYWVCPSCNNKMLCTYKD